MAGAVLWRSGVALRGEGTGEMVEETFADGITEITVTGPTVRIDLFTLSPTERDADNNPKPMIRHRVIMTLEGFMSAHDLMERVARELVNSGAVRRRVVEANGGVEPQGTRPKSPNFPVS